MQKIGFGGSCHWCTEAVFRSLDGVLEVEQGWITSDAEHATPSEAVIVSFQENAISLQTQIAIHLHTHSCTAEHSLRGKYRSAVYTFNQEQATEAQTAVNDLQVRFRPTHCHQSPAISNRSDLMTRITWTITTRTPQSHSAKTS
jgi:peptide-methionine (S)-S-oxide reductase